MLCCTHPHSSAPHYTQHTVGVRDINGQWVWKRGREGERGGSNSWLDLCSTFVIWEVIQFRPAAKSDLVVEHLCVWLRRWQAGWSRCCPQTRSWWSQRRIKMRGGRSSSPCLHPCPHSWTRDRWRWWERAWGGAGVPTWIVVCMREKMRSNVGEMALPVRITTAFCAA